MNVRATAPQVHLEYLEAGADVLVISSYQVAFSILLPNKILL